MAQKKNSLEILHWKCVFTFTRTYTQKKIGETLKDHNRSFFFSVWNAMANNVVQHAIGFLCIHSNTDIHCLILFFCCRRFFAGFNMYAFWCISCSACCFFFAKFTLLILFVDVLFMGYDSLLFVAAIRALHSVWLSL